MMSFFSQKKRPRVLLTGVDDQSESACRDIRRRGCRCVGVWSEDAKWKGRRVHRYRIGTNVNELGAFLSNHKVDQIWVAHENPSDEGMLQLFVCAEAASCAVYRWSNNPSTAGAGAAYEPLSLLLA